MINKNNQKIDVRVTVRAIVNGHIQYVANICKIDNLHMIER